MNKLIMGRQPNTQPHKWTPATLSGGLLKTNDPANNEQADNVKLIPKPKQSSFKKKFGMAFLGALTFGSVAVGTFESAGTTNLFPSRKEIEIMKERPKLKPFEPEEIKLPMPEEDKAAKLQRKLKEDINREMKRIQELEGIILDKELLSEEEREKHIEKFGHQNYFSMSSDKGKELLRLRAEFNLTKNPDLFDEYLPYRHSIKDNPKKIAIYGTLVKDLLNKVDVVFIKERFPDKYVKHNNSPKLDNCQKGDPSSCYMMAASLVELLHNRPDIINKLLEKDEQCKLILFQKDSLGGQHAGYSKIGGNLIINGSFWGGIIWNDNGSHPALHEYFHTIDRKMFILMDGVLPDMTAVQKKEFKKNREELFEQFNEKKIKYYADNTHFPYAFKNKCEFLPTTVEAFYETPKILYDISPQLYNLYRDYFKLDPLNGYKDVE